MSSTKTVPEEEISADDDEREWVQSPTPVKFAGRSKAVIAARKAFQKKESKRRERANAKANIPKRTKRVETSDEKKIRLATANRSYVQGHRSRNKAKAATEAEAAIGGMSGATAADIEHSEDA